MRKALKKATLVSALVTLTAMMAFPAVSSAYPALWLEAEGSPLGTYSANGANGYEDRATANVAGHISIYVNHPVTINAECDVTGEIELWNDGPDYSPGKNQFVDLDGANCEGTIGACQVTGMSSNGLPWAGDLASMGWTGYGDTSDYGDVDIRWLRGSCSQFATTGTLEAFNVHDSQSGGCLDEIDLDQATLSTVMGTANVSGSLDVQSVDGLSYTPDCVIGYPL